jgi:FkbM family methyltransferase
MVDERIVSFAQNGEDVVLWRALRDVVDGFYVEVGAFHPTSDSVSRLFYDRNWSGVAVEPVPSAAAAFAEARPRDVVVRAAVSNTPGTGVLHVIPDTGLSTLVDEVAQRHAGSGWSVSDQEVPLRRLDDILDEHAAGRTIHFMTVDVEGAERQVLESVDLRRHRPWVLVIEATEPNRTTHTESRWEDLVESAGYRFVLFDGLSRFYVADEHHATLGDRLSYPACVHDHFVTAHQLEVAHRLEDVHRELGATHELLRRATAERDDLVSQVVHWRGAVLRHWASAAVGGGGGNGDAAHLRAELEAMKRTLSWRVTGPLRAVRRAPLDRARRS